MSDGSRSRITVRTFTSKAEVEALEGWKDDNPFRKEDYKEILGDYDFRDRDRCCFLKEGNVNPCGKLHNFGYVIRLIDETVTIIGNICADTYFDAEEQFSKDRSRHDNEKRRLENLARLQELYANRDADFERFRTLRESLKTQQGRVESFLTEVGQQCADALRAMARDGNRNVVITGIRIREYIEDGERKQERTSLFVTVGPVIGLAALRSGAQHALLSRMSAIAQAYSKVESLMESTDSTKSSTLEELKAILSGSSQVAEDCREFVETVETFLTSDMSPLPFLVSDRGEQYRIARRGLGLSKDKAKAWLAAKERALKDAHGVDQLS